MSDDHDIEPVTDTRWRQIYNRRLEFEATEATRMLRSAGIEPILIKGWAAARKYPPAAPRFYDDVDLAVAEREYAGAKAVLSSQEADKFGIDLHRELRHLDTRSWAELFADSQVVDLNGSPIRILSEEDNLRILSVHWLSDGGIRRHRLWDIYYAVANRGPDFDWDRCLRVVSERRQGWIEAAIGIAHKYLGLSIEELPFEDRAKNLPLWLTKTVEREWNRKSPYRSLHLCLTEPKELLNQIRRRIPPNPIQSTINREGDIWEGSRLPYQFGSFSDRIFPSLRGIVHMLNPRKR
ncbi:MAG TPA: nucleotidyltransferase family protein [Pyrinomonadaceae bacterium]|nr:nucleotidyltransferase family protein [Pyrinomonadaceae bacterium]